jgi:hypothetical protein
MYMSLKKLVSRTMAWLLLLSTLFYFVFAGRYNVPNRDHFFLPMYMYICIYIGLGFALLFRRHVLSWALISAVLLAVLPLTQYGLSEYARIRHSNLGTRRHVPYRDVYTYYLLPWQHKQTGPRRFATEVLESLPQGGVIMADSTTIPPLVYMNEIENARPDVLVCNLSHLDNCWNEIFTAGKRVFTVSNVDGYHPSWVQKEWLKPFPISPTENIFEIVTHNN